jgi:hypothetical protein
LVLLERFIKIYMSLDGEGMDGEDGWNDSHGTPMAAIPFASQHHIISQLGSKPFVSRAELKAKAKPYRA